MAALATATRRGGSGPLRGRGSVLPVPGAIVFVVAMVLVVPVAVMLGGAIWSALTGWLLVEDAERSAEGTPYAVVRDATDA
jgi:hypothetical protein